MCGSFQIPWYQLRLVSTLMHGMRDTEILGVTYQKNASISKNLLLTVEELAVMREARQNKQAPSIVQGLFALMVRCATDHRDHIYSLLAVIEDSYGIVPNYELCAECVYIDAIERIVTRDKGLDILSLCKGFSEEKRAEGLLLQKNLGNYIESSTGGKDECSWSQDREIGETEYEELGTGSPKSVRCLCTIQSGEVQKVFSTGKSNIHPGSYLGVKSWVPNWPHRVQATDQAQTIRYKLLYQGEKCHFRASGQRKADYHFSKTRRDLIVTGFIFDQVIHTTGVKGTEHTKASSIEQSRGRFVLPDIWQAIRRLRLGSSFYGSNNLLMQALTRSLASGRGVGGKRLTSSDIEALHKGILERVENAKSSLQLLAQPSSFDQLVMRNWSNDMIITSKGAVGGTEIEVRQGDLVCIIFGVRVPFILRPHEDAYFLIGEAYIDGIMEGELMEEFEQGKYAKVEF